jgi:hypothetical protein
MNTKQLVNAFMDHVEATKSLDLGMFNLYLYNTYIEASVAEEHDLGSWIEDTQECKASFSDELHSYKDICLFLNKVCQFKINYYKDGE